jgi:riboflavin-specific deaminase-like protein
MGLRHAHRMRALFDAVIVGTETARIDDPQLTVRLVGGPNPVRVLIDTRLSLPASLRALSDGAAPTLLIAAASHARGRTRVGQAEVVALPTDAEGALSPSDILDALAARGLRRVYVEGGGVTVSRFMTAGCLSRLHLSIAPIVLGSGRPSLILPEINDVRQALRPRTRHVLLGEDILVDCVVERAGS